jgi:CRISPR-associated protein Csd1
MGDFMSWLQTLYATYQECRDREFSGSAVLMPICHTTLNAHVEVIIDDKGVFRRASVVTEDQNTLIPCTESSGGRAGSRPTNHPLCDKLQYLAGDFIEFGGIVTSGFKSDPGRPHTDYVETLESWTNSEFGHWKIAAILKYVKSDSLVRDLIQSGVIPVDASTGMPIHEWGSDESPPSIFKSLPNGASPLESVIRWRVERSGVAESSTWADTELMAAWVSYETSAASKSSLCFVSGAETRPVENPPARVRHGGDKAKLISSNDTTGYTFRGRFHTPEQAAQMGFEVVQKAHNALRWLIERQGYRNGDQVYVAWTPAGDPVPDPFSNSAALFLSPDELSEERVATDLLIQTHDVGQEFSIRLRKAMAGYGSQLTPSSKVLVIGLDSATPGRMAVTYYRELAGTDFLKRVESWHEHTAWLQEYSSRESFVGAPSPKDVAEAAYGRRLDEKLKKATVERLIPCIIDGATIPYDLVASLVNRTLNRVGLDNWEFKKVLGICCAMFRGFSYSKGKEYSMALNVDSRSRDYLYGRLLAIAEHLESRALYLSGENRDTNAARQMHRFADRPYSAWQHLELSLGPYRSQLRSKRPGTLKHLESELDSVMSLFEQEDFKSDKKLSGEFLLAYHCQRRDLWSKNEQSDNEIKGE